jgi:hypothetical protein
MKKEESIVCMSSSNSFRIQVVIVVPIFTVLAQPKYYQMNLIRRAKEKSKRIKKSGTQF